MSTDFPADLPILAALPKLAAALDAHSRVVLEAPPGAGKSTYLPLWLWQRDGAPNRRILLLQPRRLAAAGVADYLARQSGHPLGTLVGLRTRFERKISKDTIIEVLTEGVFLRQVQRDPELSGVRHVLFDEYHERSWQADLALGLALESQNQWRSVDEPLQLLVMSATLPGEAIAQWLQAANVRVDGRSFPVAVEYSPAGRNDATAHVVASIRQALRDGARRVLVFLAGWQPMQRVAQQLAGQSCEVLLLHSSVAPEQQRRALQFDPAAPPSVVLATNIAETSLTIPGVDTVIDSGEVRRSVFDPRRGMDRLETGWISRASAEQRAGRAGRLGPGRCIRLWDREQQGRLIAHDPAEVQQVDLAPLALELALWGGTDAAAILPELPPPQRLRDARQLLQRLGAVDGSDRITAAGRAMVELGLHPRLGSLVLRGRERGEAVEACLLAALLAEGDFVRGGPIPAPIDLEWRLHLLQERTHGAEVNRATVQRILQLAKQLAARGGGAAGAKGGAEADPGALLLAAFPDRLARRREQGSGRYLCVDGFEVVVAEGDPLRAQEWLVVAEHDGNRQGGRVRLAAAVAAAEVARSAAIETVEVAAWDEARELLGARRQRRLGAIVLDDAALALDDERAGRLWLQLLRERGLDWLQWSESTRQWLARARWVRNRLPAWPDFSEAALLAELEQWLAPYLERTRRLADLRALDFLSLLRNRLDYAQQRQLAESAPERFLLPSGNTHALAYGDDAAPKLAARLTEFYGMDEHPHIGGEPLLLELLSPARRPVQLTRDLPGFWRSSYPEVRKEMRGSYPKHFWPEQPWSAPATATTKKRMQSPQ